MLNIPVTLPKVSSWKKKGWSESKPYVSWTMTSMPTVTISPSLNISRDFGIHWIFSISWHRYTNELLIGGIFLEMILVFFFFLSKFNNKQAVSAPSSQMATENLVHRILSMNILFFSFADMYDLVSTIRRTISLETEEEERDRERKGKIGRECVCEREKGREGKKERGR